jgi:hypothetical protein
MATPNQQLKKILDELKGYEYPAVKDEEEVLFGDLMPLDNELFKVEGGKLKFRDGTVLKDNYCGKLSDTECKNIELCLQKIKNDIKTSGSLANFNNLNCFKTQPSMATTSENIYNDIIKDLHPEVVLSVLNALEFHVRKTVQGLKRVESIEEHEIRVPRNDRKYISPAPAAPVAQDVQITKEYIKALIHYVNKNPVILNPGYAKAQQESFKSHYGIPQASPRRVDVSVTALRDRIKDYTRSLRMDLSLNGSPLVVFRGVGLHQFGGSHLGADSVSRPALNLKYQQKYSVSKVFKEIYQLNLRRLKDHNKDLSKATQEAIEAQFEKLEEYENKVVQAINILEKFSQVTSANKDYSHDLVTGNKMKETVEKFNHLLDRKERRELSILSIIEALVKAVDTEKTKESSTLGVVPASTPVV